MKPSKAMELPVHSDLSETAIEGAFETLQIQYPDMPCLKVSVWDVQVACELMVRMKRFDIKITPNYSVDEWSLEHGDECVWTHGA